MRSPRPSVGAEERVGRVEQVRRCRRRRAARGRCRRRSRCRWSRSASARTRAGRRSSGPRPPGRCRRRASTGSWSSGDGHVGAAARRDPRHLGLVVDLLGADPVGPDAGRVDHVVGLDLERSPVSASTAGDPGGAPVAVEQPGDLGAVDAARRRSARPRRGSSAPGGRRRSGSRRTGRPRAARGAASAGISSSDLLAVDRAVAVGRPVVVAAARARRARGATCRPAWSPSRRTC